MLYFLYPFSLSPFSFNLISSKIYKNIIKGSSVYGLLTTNSENSAKKYNASRTQGLVGERIGEPENIKKINKK